MNDKLLEQIKQLKNAVARFAEVLELPETDVNRDATIQRIVNKFLTPNNFIFCRWIKTIF